MEEVRLRVSAPLYYIYKNKEYTAGNGFRVSREDVDETLQCAARSPLCLRGGNPAGFLTVQSPDTGLAWLEGRYWKTDI
ncbi:MAG: hypothetical protein ACLR8P_14310 [Clostridium fessum]